MYFKNNKIALSLRQWEPILIFLFALGIRLSLLPYFRHLSLYGDEFYYWTSARGVAGGHLTNNFLHPPIWTYTLSIPALYDNIFYGRLFTAIISSFSVPLIYFLGKHAFNRRVGITAGIIYAIYPNILGFSHYLWPETLLSLLILLSTYIFFKILDDKNKNFFLYLSFFISSLALLVKEFEIIHFGSIIVALFFLSVINKKQTIIRAIIIFFTPIIIYSAYASFLAKRPVMLADAFVYNSNEADYGKKVWKKSTKDNLKIFIDRLFILKEIPARFTRQIYNLWTPNSFLIFRLLHSRNKYTNVPLAPAIAYFSAGMYIAIMVFGLTGLICDGMNLFKVFAIANLLFLSSAGLLFLMCSRFRIPFMYIFIVYSSVVLSNSKEILRKITWQKSLALLAILILFINIIYVKSSTFGYWG